jgi:tetratricopeptide (TPR) repeat protein
LPTAVSIASELQAAIAFRTRFDRCNQFLKYPISESIIHDILSLAIIMVNQTVLDELWDFDHPEVSEQKFAELAEDGTLPNGERQEYLTQQARALGLQKKFERADQLLDSLESPVGVVAVRQALERGRVLNISGKRKESIPVFKNAVELATTAKDTFLLVDALHMLGIVDPDRGQQYQSKALEVLSTETNTRTLRWLVALHNNQGWNYYDFEKYAEALLEFEKALEAAKKYGTPHQQFLGEWAIGYSYKSLGRLDDARAVQEKLATEYPKEKIPHPLV